MSKYFTRDFEDAYTFCKMLIKNKSYKLRDVFEGEKREKNVIDLCLKSNLIIIKNYLSFDLVMYLYSLWLI